MASFDLATGEDTDPAWYETFYKPADQDWWDTGPHKALGQSFARGGDWVRAYMKRHPERVHRSVTHPSDKGRDFVAWTAQETMRQIELWVESMRQDMQAFARVGDTHRPRTRTLIIPQDGHRGEGAIIHDVRGFLAARVAGLDTDSVPIPALVLDATIEPRFHAASRPRRSACSGA